MFDIVLTPAERALLEALNALGVPFLIVGMGAALLEGAAGGAHEYELDGVPVKVLPLERVIASKLAANRAKDAAQMPMLEAALAARRARFGRG